MYELLGLVGNYKTTFSEKSLENCMQSSTTLTRLSVVLSSLRHYPKLLWPVALGIAAATATIIGALLVGDSLRGSLRYLALDRLGRIEYVLLAPNFFDGDYVRRQNPSSIERSIEELCCNCLS